MTTKTLWSSQSSKAVGRVSPDSGKILTKHHLLIATRANASCILRGSSFSFGISVYHTQCMCKDEILTGNVVRVARYEGECKL